MNARLAIALVTAAAFLGWSFTDDKVAASVPKVVKPNAAVKPAAPPTHSHILAELHEAKHLLDHANHKYNHHRSNADHHIAKAIHLLHPHHTQAATTATPAAAPHKHVHEAQQASDAHLKHAEHLVKHALSELHKHHGEIAHEAREHLHHAVHEIEMALHVHHKN